MRIAMVVPALLLSAAAAAQDFSYNYIEGVGSESKNNDTDVTLEIASATVSIQSKAGAFLQVTGAVGDADDIRAAEGGPEGDYRAFEVAFGGARQLRESTSAWTAIGLGKEKLEPDNAGEEFDPFTARFSLGLRQWLLPRVEAHASGSFLYYEEDDNDNGEDIETRVGVRIYPLRNVSINAEAAWQFEERVQIFSASLRYDF